MRMLRLENEKGLGPYRGTKNFIWEDIGHYTSGLRPDPMDDPLLREVSIDPKFRCYKFGFKDTKQYKKWFSKKERVKLFTKGFKLRVYYPKKYIISEYQMIGLI